MLEVNLGLTKSFPKRVLKSVITLCQHHIFAAITIIIGSALKEDTQKTLKVVHIQQYSFTSLKKTNKQNKRKPNEKRNKWTTDLFWGQ